MRNGERPGELEIREIRCRETRLLASEMAMVLAVEAEAGHGRRRPQIDDASVGGTHHLRDPLVLWRRPTHQEIDD